jgi:hypothetical protein
LLNFKGFKKNQNQQFKNQVAFFKASRNCIKSSLTAAFGFIERVNFPQGSVSLHALCSKWCWMVFNSPNTHKVKLPVLRTGYLQRFGETPPKHIHLC